jgi:hypothetical protein
MRTTLSLKCCVLSAALGATPVPSQQHRHLLHSRAADGLFLAAGTAAKATARAAPTPVCNRELFNTESRGSRTRRSLLNAQSDTKRIAWNARFPAHPLRMVAPSPHKMGTSCRPKHGQSALHAQCVYRSTRLCFRHSQGPWFCATPLGHTPLAAAQSSV